ncbi:MAG: DUF4340 domain-containing protein [Proteobacteria bacterium]|nr:DUF4340 domain-containing protein [Pseudomonadota bacterium]MBI3498478.1 DUF4340 domain-containing protein [Pseudomonadota bacterium]
MRPNTVVALGAVTLIATGTAAYLAYQRAAATLGRVASETVLPGFIARVNDVASLEFKRAAGTVSVARWGDLWVMPDHGNYPVRYEVIKQNLVTMGELTTVEAKTAKPDLHDRIEVEDVTAKDAKSTLVSVKDAQGQTMAELIVGKRRYAPIGGKDMVYVRKPGDNRAWLAVGVFDLRPQASEWLVREISNVSDRRWRLISFSHPDGATASLSRKDVEQQNYDVDGLPEGRQIKPPGVVNATASAFEFLNLDDVTPAGQLTDTTPVATSVFESFDGLAMNAVLSEKDGAFWATFSAEARPGADGAAPADTAKDEAAALNEKLRPWAYKLPEWKANFFKRKMDDLIEAAKQS